MRMQGWGWEQRGQSGLRTPPPQSLLYPLPGTPDGFRVWVWGKLGSHKVIGEWKTAFGTRFLGMLGRVVSGDPQGEGRHK